MMHPSSSDHLEEPQLQPQQQPQPQPQQQHLTPTQQGGRQIRTESTQDLPFFADASLDLSEAHEIAETPEAPRQTIPSAVAAASVQLPFLPLHHNDNNAPTGFAIDGGPASQARELGEQAREAESNKSSFARITSHFELSNNAQLPKQRPRWPRDLPWAVAFLVLCPTFLLWPILLQQHQHSHDTPTSANTTNGKNKNHESTEMSSLVLPPLSTATVHALWWATVLTFFLSRFFYRTAAGRDGDDARYWIGQVLVGSVPVAVVLYGGLTLAVVAWTTHAWWAALIPLYFAITNIVLLRKWRKTGDAHQAFFQALCSMALDLLSKSLKRHALQRVLSACLILQTAALFVWRWALLSALQQQSPWLLAVAILGGKWCTGTVARLLSLIASGGIVNWFVEHQEHESQNPPSLSENQYHDEEDQHHLSSSSSSKNNNTLVARSNSNNPNEANSATEDPLKRAMSSGNDSSNNHHNNSDMPEAYRTADASIYQSVLTDDDDDDDDDDGYGIDDDDEFESESLWESRSTRTSASNHHHQHVSAAELKSRLSTVKSLLAAGLTVSFGSVTQCGLLGGLAQYVWSQLRKVDAAKTIWVHLREQYHARAAALRRHNSNNGDGTLSSMPIGQVDERRQQRRQAVAGFFKTIGWKFQFHLRQFVRSHSDLAMSHVAAYYKPYTRAAKDVATLIEQSGMEGVLHQDITTHLCASIGGVVSGTIVLFTGYVLMQDVWHAQKTSQAAAAISDGEIIQDMILSFVLCYTLIFTVMEPLRASIKAVYVSFAQHPNSLRQAYPLIYQRLRRLSTEASSPVS